VCESVDLPDPFGPHHRMHLAFGDAERNALQDLSPLDARAQVSNLEISQLTFRSPSSHRLQSSAASAIHVVRGHLAAQEPLVHVLLVDTREPRAGRDILDGAVAMANREPSVAELDHFGHVPVLRGEPGQLADSRFKV